MACDGFPDLFHTALGPYCAFVPPFVYAMRLGAGLAGHVVPCHFRKWDLDLDGYFSTFRGSNQQK